jgi:uncharacterized membrane protein
MKRTPNDIVAVIAIALVAAALSLLAPIDVLPVRLLTLPLVLILPGYALTSALFPRQALQGPERIVCTVALSIVVSILGGLILNVTPDGLRSESWTVLLTLITLGACGLALSRRRAAGIPPNLRVRVGNGGLSVRQRLLLGLSAVIVGGAVAVSIMGAERQSYAGFTQLWILPGGRVQNKDVVRVGVHNGERTAMDYRLALSVNGKVIQVSRSIRLAPKGNWESAVYLAPDKSGTASRVGADLYRTFAPARLYRHVVLWLNSSQKGSRAANLPVPSAAAGPARGTG